jgi:hypothetical protein
VNAELGDRLPKPGPYHPVVVTLLAHRILSGRPGRRLALEPEDREYAAELSRGIVDDLAAMGVDVVGDLADLVPEEQSTEAGSATTTGYGVSGDSLRDEAVAALAALLDSYSAKTVTSAARRQQLRGRVDAASAQLAKVRRERAEVRAELRATRSQVTALTRRLTQLERRLADTEAERNRLADEARRPLHRLAAGVTERVPVLARVRGLYRRTVGFARSRAQSDGWGEG